VVSQGDIEEDFIDEVARNFRLELNPMGCNFDTLAAAINNVAAALKTQTSSGAGSNCADCQVVCVQVDDINPDGTDDATPTDGEFEPASENYPDGFDSKADYLQYKCEVANLIIDGVLKAMRTMGALTSLLAVGQVIAATVAAATAGTIIILPPLGFLAVVAAVVAVLAAGFVSTELLLTMADELEAERQDIVCRLYESANTLEAVSSTIDGLEIIISAAIVAGGIPGPLTATASTFLGTIVAKFFNSDTLNQLFTLVADINYAGADCSTCGTVVGCPFEFQFGSGTIFYDGQLSTLTAELSGGFYILNATVHETGESEFSNWCVEFVAAPGIECSSANFNRELYWSSADVYNFGTEQFDFNHNPGTCFPPLAQDLPIMGFAFTSDAPFTVELRVNGAVGGTTEAPSVSTACEV
jgi:hypothetical protein